MKKLTTEENKMVIIFTYNNFFQFGTLAELSNSEIDLLKEVCQTVKGRALVCDVARKAAGMERVARFATGDTEDAEAQSLASRILILCARMVGFGVERGFHNLPLQMEVVGGELVITSPYRVVSLD
jgi:hypothetical protein